VRDGKPYKMGKRLGHLITCDEVLDEIDEALGKGAGADALRYFYLSRRTENPVELDVELAKKATLDNPAIYLQYGHARLCSILRKAAENGLTVPALTPALEAKLTHPLCGLVGGGPRRSCGLGDLDAFVQSHAPEQLAARIPIEADRPSARAKHERMRGG
jgi:hypothetical protein